MNIIDIILILLSVLCPTGKFLSMGYGFVEYIKKQSADKALKTLQHTDLDGHHLELKISNRATM